MNEPSRISIFECSSNTYAECVQKGLFGSNLPWPLQVKTGDLCFLYHYEVSTLFGMWRAEGNGARNITPKAWGGRFPFQVRVKLMSSDIVEVPKDIVTALAASSSDGRLGNLLSVEQAETLSTWALGKSDSSAAGGPAS